MISSSCSQTCGVGGYRIRTRTFNLVGKDGNSCNDVVYQKDECFVGCCDKEFYCAKTKKCIPKTKVCNYVNDCGGDESEDEDDFMCKERCYVR